MDVKVRIKAISLSILAFIIIALTVIGLGTANFNNPNDFELVQLESGWTICRDGIDHPVESLSNASVGVANKGDVITLTTVLPTDLEVKQATIEFRSILSTVDVYLDEKLIYSVGQSYVAAGDMLPKFHNFIPLPSNYEGKSLKIVFTAQENNAFSGFSPVLLGHYKDIANKLLQPNRLAIVVGIFLSILGFILLTISPLLAFSEYHDYSFLFSGAISLFMGTYILCYNDIFWYVSNKPSLYTLLEYLSLFMISPSMLGFVMTTGQIYHRKATKFILAFNILFVAVTFVLHITNAVHICHFVTVFHLISLIEGLFILISLIIIIIGEFKKSGGKSPRTMSATMLITGFIFYLTCAIIDIIKFNYFKYGSNGEMNVSINFTTIGALLFMICLFLNYFFHRIEYLSDSASKTRLEGLAYSDPLTGLSNRSKCELVMAELSGNYTIISLDLDYLKYTNDNYGHSEGDKLLTGFADILKESFTDAILLGRMGGDEYVIILPFVDENRTKRDINCMIDQMAYRTSKEDHIRYSASWGYATSSESATQGISAQGVYLLADQRMYEMKNLHHNQSLGRLYEDLIKKTTHVGGATND